MNTTGGGGGGGQRIFGGLPTKLAGNLLKASLLYIENGIS